MATSSFARPPGIPTLSNQYQYHSPDGSSKWKGPRRVCIFCSLAVVLPSLLISIPLLMRFVIYGNSSYLVHPSDMMLLDQRISTTWCQGESIKVNTSFTAYITPGEPSLFETPTTLAIDHEMRIPDDQKEYWGLYLLPGSTFRIKSCAKSKGGTLLIVRGYKHLEHCAYIGEADSAGHSDQVSGSMSVEAMGKLRGQTGQGLDAENSEDEQKIFSRLKNYLQQHPNSRNKIHKTLEEWMLLNSTVKTVPVPAPTTSPAPIEDLLPNDSIDHGKIVRQRREIDIRKDTESGENGAFEEDYPGENITEFSSEKNASVLDLKSFQTPNSIWNHNPHSGVFNDTVDYEGSDSESESSFSSSEEALLKCEGIIATFKIPRDEQCKSDGQYDDLILSNSSGGLSFEFQVEERDYYYFIFGSENEKETNLIRSKFELQKVEYRLPEPVANCTNVEECQISFGFASSEKVVIRLPQPMHNATSKLVYLAETECKPRAHLYLIFVILVPVVILMFAFK